jgi:ATP-independent RNA helicase DbpA
MKKFLVELGIKELNPMQKNVVKESKTFSNLLILSPTGSGKTLAFLLPLINKIQPQLKDIQALIIAPSRELALQIEGVLKQMKTNLRTACFYGGHDYKSELNSLSNTPQILIGTPGRLVDHLRKGNIDFSTVKNLVCDEFDKSLEYGFERDIMTLLSEMDNLSSVTLTSATQAIEVPNYIPFENFKEINYLHTHQPSKYNLQIVRAKETDKVESLLQLLCELNNEPTIVFCNHRDAVERVADLLKEMGIVFAKYHGGLKQDEREKALFKLKSNSVNVLLSTDLGSRGLDIDGIKHIIHYQLPNVKDAYVHRNGRTARVDKTGNVYFILSQDEYLPDFVDKKEVTEKILNDEYFIPELPVYETVFVNAGKKNKINKIDLVGTFCQKGGLEKSELGLIEVKDYFSVVAVDRNQANFLVKNLKNVQIKKKTVFVAIAK